MKPVFAGAFAGGGIALSIATLLESLPTVYPIVALLLAVMSVGITLSEAIR